LGPKHVVLIAKANVNGEINSCIIDGKLYKTSSTHRSILM
jgi:hypothetical protein